MFLLDSFAEIYVWIGWWPVIENKLLKDANATTGSAYSRWLQDKRLALETALLYSKGTIHQPTPLSLHSTSCWSCSPYAGTTCSPVVMLEPHETCSYHMGPVAVCSS